MAARRRLLRWLGIGLSVLVGVLAALYIVGGILPRDHTARMEIAVQSPPERVWAPISDFAGTARWRDDVTHVERLPMDGGALRFVEVSRNGTVTFEVVGQDPPSRQVVCVVDDGQPFGGTWTWTIEPDGAGSRVAIVEQGFVKSPPFRVMARLFFPPTRTIDGYLRALARELGESAVPREAPAP